MSLGSTCPRRFLAPASAATACRGQEAPSRRVGRNANLGSRLRALVRPGGAPGAAGPRRPEATTGDFGQIRAALPGSKDSRRVTLFQRARLDPGGETRWMVVQAGAARAGVRVETDWRRFAVSLRFSPQESWHRFACRRCLSGRAVELSLLAVAAARHSRKCAPGKGRSE